MNKGFFVILFCVIIISLSGCINPFPDETDNFCKEKGYELGEQTTKEGKFAIYCYAKYTETQCVENVCREKTRHNYKYFKSEVPK